LLGAFTETLTHTAPDAADAANTHDMADAANLAAVLSAWETLPAPIKAGIVAMVKAVPK